MITETIFCDCCGIEVKVHHWTETPYPFGIQVTTDCQNPLGYLKESPGYQSVNLQFKHVCLTCATGLAKVVADFITKRRKD